MPLGHTNCPIIDGWQGRLQAKLAAAGAVIMMTASCTPQTELYHDSIFAPTGVGGTLAGAVLAVLQQKQILAHSLGTAASCMICVGGFAGVLHHLNLLPFLKPLLTDTCTMTVCQETSRLLRCEDSPANSIVAGAAAGALLLGLQRKLWALII
jgi:hypothetical protein